MDVIVDCISADVLLFFAGVRVDLGELGALQADPEPHTVDFEPNPATTGARISSSKLKTAIVPACKLSVAIEGEN